MRKTFTLATAGLLVTASAIVFAQAPSADPKKNPESAVAGTYDLDPAHASVIIKIPHSGGISLSTFRFDKTAGKLTWNGSQPDASSVQVTVDSASLVTPVPGFAAELQGERFLNSARYPTAQFVSTEIRRLGPTNGQITGNLTLMGVTRPIVIDATMVGAGKDFRGNSAVGFSGTGTFKRSDFGMTTMVGPIGDEVQLHLELEFKLPKPPAPAN